MTAHDQHQVESFDPAEVSGWIGRQRVAEETISAIAVDHLAAIFDMEAPPAEPGTVPAGWHWVTFVPNAPASRIGRDGHPLRGDFIPPIPFPRRMFGGAQAQFHQPLRTGVEARLTETITSIERKDGRSGPLVFLRLARQFEQAGALCVTEDQTIIYRPAAQPSKAASGGGGAAVDTPAEWREVHKPSPVDLFRFSAVTFNAHRIHYDRDYARGEEGYPGLVIHGPYTALRLLEEARARSPGRALRRFDFRPVAPLFDHGGFVACGRFTDAGADLWAETPDGALAMTALAVFETPASEDAAHE